MAIWSFYNLNSLFRQNTPQHLKLHVSSLHCTLKKAMHKKSDKELSKGGEKEKSH